MFPLINWQVERGQRRRKEGGGGGVRLSTSLALLSSGREMS